MHQLILNKTIGKKHKARVITIGNYDGVHMGHQHVIKQCVKKAVEKKALASVLVFEPHPQQYFGKGSGVAMGRITSFRERYKQLKQQGVQELICHPFNARVAALSPESFVAEVLCHQLHMAHLVVGEDFCFGKERRGDFALLQDLSHVHGFTVERAKTVYCDKQRISSSLIRQLLASGEFQSVNKYLGRPFHIEGKVIHGEKRAGLLGFPTANIHLKNKPQALRGVYVVEVEGVNTNETCYGVANVGVRPTVDGKRWLLEVHVFDEEGIDLYGKCLTVIFKEKLRDEQRFPDMTALQEQITQDVAQAKAYNAILVQEEPMMSAKNYKDTLNLPKTAFPMKGNLPQREPERLRQWDAMNVYHALRKHCAGRPRYILHDGPPYANGAIHIGHAVNKTLKDMVVKSKTLSGFDAPYVPGWDCHGLPIELNVEKKKGKPGIDITPTAFRQACREYARTQIDRQRDDFIRLGIFGEWENPYLTLNHGYEANIIRSLAQIVANGHLHKGYKPVHWCVDCGSALAEAEVEYKNKTSPAVDVRFPLSSPHAFWLQVDVKEGVDVEDLGRPSMVIWTTTPWTLPANEGVALHSDFTYAVVALNDSVQGKVCFVVADDRVEAIMERYGEESYSIVATCLGSALEGLQCQHPFYDKTVPVVLGEHVTLDSGTGAVHTAPGHGVEDYLLGVKYHLPVDHPVSANGCFVEGTPLFAGEHVFKANDHVIEVLKQQGHLVHTHSVEHSYPHCWRHKTPLIFRATPQWFVGMEKQGLRKEALQAISQVQWIPQWGEARITDMIGNRPDWCISRQRHWGVPLPVFIHKQTGQLHPDTPALLQRAADLVEEEGIDGWFNLDIATWLGEEAPQYDKVEDVLDVWFDSGVSHACVLETRPDLQFPADMYLEGSDQHRGWFQTSLLSAIAMGGEAPYKTVLTHGYAVDGDGRKMSKSLGNVIAPNKVVKQYGADVLRLWVASIDYRSEMTVSEEILKRTADTYRRIRNTARYFLSNLTEFNPANDAVAFKDMLALDQWAMDQAYQVQQEITQAYEQFHFHHIVKVIHNFCSVAMGSFYLDVIKDRQYTTQANSRNRRSAQTAMYHMMEAMVRWLAPILSFTAEEIWQHMPAREHDTVFFTTWYEGLQPLPKNALLSAEQWEQVITLRDAVNHALEQARAAGTVGSSLDAEVTLYCDETWQQLLHPLGDELRFVLITSEARMALLSEAPSQAIDTVLEGVVLTCEASTFPKCTRCWHHGPSVGQTTEHPDLCHRCVTNVEGEGEKREIA